MSEIKLNNRGEYCGCHVCLCNILEKIQLINACGTYIDDRVCLSDTYFFFSKEGILTSDNRSRILEVSLERMLEIISSTNIE